MSQLSMPNRLFVPVLTSYLGFDSFFNELDHLISEASKSQVNTSTYPPMNLFKEADGGYTIELAVAGFKKEDLTVSLNKGTRVLTISGDARPKASVLDKDAIVESSLTAELRPPREVIKSSIATRLFWRSFTISDNLEIGNVSLENGLLVIRLVEVKKPADDIVTIDIA